MAQDILMERRGNQLVPFDACANEQLEELPHGKPLTFKVSQPRSTDQNRWYWVELSHVVKATECAPTSRHLHQALKLALRYTMPVFDAKGEIVSHIPDSTAFDAMTQQEFNIYFQAAQKLVAERWGYVMEPRRADPDHMKGEAA